MLPQILPKTRFQAFVGRLMGDGRVAAPVERGHQYAFEVLDGPADLAKVRMDYDITILPPKKFLTPQHDVLLDFSGPSPGSASAAVSALPTVILGVHPYDLHGIATLDAVFNTSPTDPYYQSRRQATRLIGLNIRGYVNDCQFMADMGSAEAPQGGFDLFWTDLGDRWFVEVGSDAGEQMVASGGLFTPAGPDDHRARQAYDRAKQAALPHRLPYDTRYLPELLEASYDSLLWDAVARRCFSCGTCTNVCPTCYCFDVQDKLNIDAASGVRQRQWDSCQLRVFAEVAGGENFREHRASRLRHRMFRKGKYVLEQTGKLGCVGCGRCIHHCVADISILEAFQQIAGDADQAASAPKRGNA
jgi:ferredoxin